MIGARALQIAMGAPFLVKIDEKRLEELKYNPVEIAKLEFEGDVIPLEVLRKTPEYIEDKGRHPIVAKSDGIAESVAAEELSIVEEDEEGMEASGEEVIE